MTASLGTFRSAEGLEMAKEPVVKGVVFTRALRSSAFEHRPEGPYTLGSLCLAVSRSILACPPSFSEFERTLQDLK